MEPQIIDELSNCSTIELSDLNIRTMNKPISEIFFLDNENIIFSLYNDKSNVDTANNFDLYKYNISSNKLTLLCLGYTLYCDDMVVVRDINNFLIINNKSYLDIEDSKVKIKRDVLSEAKAKFEYAVSAIYNESNNKILILENSIEPMINKVYITDERLNNQEELPFENIYRAQWADNDHVLVACKDNTGNSLLIKYSLTNKDSITTFLPEGTYFIDPLVFDKDIVRFLYLEDPRIEIPWGFLSLKNNIINLVNFDSCNPTSIVRSGEMAGFSLINANDYTTSTTYLK